MGRVFKFPKTEFQYSGVVSSGSAVYIDTFPEQEGALTYDGTEQMPIWKNLDLMKLLIDGELSAVSAGVHYVTVTPVGNFRWPDKTQTPRQVPYLIKRKPIEKQPTLAAELTFNGLEQTPLWNDFDAEIMTVGGVCQNQIDAGTYTATFTPDSNHCWKDGSYTPIEVEWKINVLELTKPTASISSLSWNNSTQNLTLANFNATFMTESGTVSAKDVGNYSATVELISSTNTRWKDGSVEPIEISWQIKKLAIAKPTTNNANLTFAERWQEPTWVNYNATYMTKTGGTLYNVGESTTTVFALKDTVNTSWADGSTENVNVKWQIGRKMLLAPEFAQTEFTFDRKTHSPVFKNHAEKFENGYETETGQNRNSAVNACNRGTGGYLARYNLKEAYQKNYTCTADNPFVLLWWYIDPAETTITFNSSLNKKVTTDGRYLIINDASLVDSKKKSAVVDVIASFFKSSNPLFTYKTDWKIEIYGEDEKFVSDPGKEYRFCFREKYTDGTWSTGTDTPTSAKSVKGNFIYNMDAGINFYAFGMMFSVKYYATFG